jgi:F-type H+-transporting ATPase subunit epsilon
MRNFTLILRSSTAVQRIEGVRSFVGEDASGSFGIKAGHARFMTCLSFGLARFRDAQEAWHYLAMPGAVLYFVDNVLNLSTRRYFLDDDYERITAALEQQLLAEEQQLRGMKDSLKQLEQEILKRMWKIGHEEIIP